MRVFCIFIILILTVSSVNHSHAQSVKTEKEISDNQISVIVNSITLEQQQRSDLFEVLMDFAKKYLKAYKTIDNSTEFEKELTAIYIERDKLIKDLLTLEQAKKYDELLESKKLNYQ